MATYDEKQIALIKQYTAEVQKLEKLGKKISDAQTADLAKWKKKIDSAKKLQKNYKLITIEQQSQVDLSLELMKSMKGQTGFLEGLESTHRSIVNLAGKEGPLAKKLAKALGVVVDNAATIQQNMEAIGSDEFRSLDLNKQIFDMKKMIKNSDDKSLKNQIKFLQLQQNLQDRLQKVHDITTETANQFMKPVKYMRDLIGTLPIVGGILSKLIPVDKWEDQIKTKLAGSLKKAFAIKEIETPKEAGEAAAKTWNEFQHRMKTSSTEASKLWKKQKKGAKVQKNIKEDTTETAKGLGKGKMAAIGVGAALAIVAGLVAKAALSMFKFANETGLSYTQTIKIGRALLVNAEAVKALTEEFGNINGITTMMAVDMLQLNKQYGISASASAKILKLQTATSGQTHRQLLGVQKQVAQMARLEGVSPAAVFESMAANSEDFAKFTKDSGKNLMKMAIQAKKVGLEMSTITGAMEGSLDLESSINAQFEASVLLGRQLNMDKFRQLSLAGDALGAQQEIVRLAGSEAEWNRMNTVARSAMAKAFGMQVNEVAKMIGAQQNVSKEAETSKKTFSKMGMIIGGVAGLLIALFPAIRTAFTFGASAAADALSVAKGTAILVGGGIAGVAVGAGVSHAVSGATMNPGTVANVRRGEMTIHKGETAVRTQDFNMLPMIEELKALRKDMRVGSTERAEQSRQQINTIRGIGAANA